MRLVIVESPYAGDIERHTEYARAAVRHSLGQGEAPIASHLLYPQPGILREEIPEERQWGIDAGRAWATLPEVTTVFYVDLGWSPGMVAAQSRMDEEGFQYEVRNIRSAWWPRDPLTMRCVTCGDLLTPSSGEWWLPLQWLHEAEPTLDKQRPGRVWPGAHRPILPYDWRDRAKAWSQVWSPEPEAINRSSPA